MTVDSGIVSAAAEGEPAVRAHLEALRRHGVEVVIPASVIAETTTGEGPDDARVNAVIGGCRIVDTNEAIARRAAALRHMARRPEATVEAIVVATSELAGGAALLTRCPDDRSAALAALTRVRVQTP